MKKMRLALMFVALAAISAKSYAAMSLNEIRHEARFLTDRMGHELGLSNRQYEDVYEINFDFLYQVNEVIDDVVYGYDDAIDYYYYLLDVRNEDLMYVLRNSQYRKFVNREYFYRPIHMVNRTWRMRIWDRYSDRDYFYFSIPVNFNTYIGAHNRIHFTLSYYADRYTHKLFEGAFRLWGGGYNHHKHDGWKNLGKKKHTFPNSRPWSNAKNYEKSRHDLKEGFVNIPSRDSSKRKVKVSSEENRRTAVISDTPTRKGNSANRSSSSDVKNSTRNANTSNSVRSNSSSNSGSSSKRNDVSRSSNSNSNTRSSNVSSNGSSRNSSNNAGSNITRGSNVNNSSNNNAVRNASSASKNSKASSVTRISSSNGSSSNRSSSAGSSVSSSRSSASSSGNSVSRSSSSSSRSR